jgi:hypothetical protein
LAARPARAGHLRGGSCLVDEDKPLRLQPHLGLPLSHPFLARLAHVGPIALAGLKALWNGPPLLPAMYARRHFQEEEWE